MGYFTLMFRTWQIANSDKWEGGGAFFAGFQGLIAFLWNTALYNKVKTHAWTGVVFY